MKWISSVKLVLICTTVYLAAITGVNAENVKAVVLANTCFSCHGADGRSVGAMPSIAGKSPKYIAKLLKEFRADKRKATVMNRISKGFTDGEIDMLAKYFSAK